jgi:hypothetical protein
LLTLYSALTFWNPLEPPMPFLPKLTPRWSLPCKRLSPVSRWKFRIKKDAFINHFLF